MLRFAAYQTWRAYGAVISPHSLACAVSRTTVDAKPVDGTTATNPVNCPKIPHAGLAMQRFFSDSKHGPVRRAGGLPAMVQAA